MLPAITRTAAVVVRTATCSSITPDRQLWKLQQRQRRQEQLQHTHTHTHTHYVLPWCPCHWSCHASIHSLARPTPTPSFKKDGTPIIEQVVELLKQGHISVGQRENLSFPHSLDIPAYIQPAALASLLGVTVSAFAKKARQVLPWWPRTMTKKKLLKTGYADLKTIVLNYEEAAAITKQYKKQPQLKIMEGTDLRVSSPPRLIKRSPVVAILGHKDHGKTTLLDTLRGTKVASKEEFGITQDTYCYQVELDELTTDPESRRALAGAAVAGTRRTFTFLDTPGHHSFTEMRINGVAHADLVMLVVAADEGLLDQTFECLNIITQLKTPVLIVITKIDSPKARVDAVKSALTRLGAKLLDADHPSISTKGRIVAVPVSAKAGTNLHLLRKALFGVCSLFSLTADAAAVASGRVVEAWTEEKGRGQVVRVILKQGRVKGMRNSYRERIMEGGAGIPIELIGLQGLPVPGSDFFVCSQQGADAIATVRHLEYEYPRQDRKQKTATQAQKTEQTHNEEQERLSSTKTPLSKTTASTAASASSNSEEAFAGVEYDFTAPASTRKNTEEQHLKQEKDSEKEEVVDEDEEAGLPVIIKANSVGSLRMLFDSIDIINSRQQTRQLLDAYTYITPLRMEVFTHSSVVNIVEASVGSLTKSDIQLSQAWDCPIYCYRVSAPTKQDQLAIQRYHVETHEFRHFQQILDHIQQRITQHNNNNNNNNNNNSNNSKHIEDKQQAAV